MHGGEGGSLKTLSWDKVDGISKIEGNTFCNF